MKHLVEANCRFSVNLFKQQIIRQPGRNCISFSLGAELPLAMLWLGSEGKTADEIREVLNWGETVTSTDDPRSGSECDRSGGYHSQLSQLLSVINRHARYNTMKTGTRLYGSKEHLFLERFIQCAKELYKSECERVDFMDSTEEVRKKINSWVERQTDGDITNFFPVNSIDRYTTMVLLNTVSFKGKWNMPFNPRDTHKGVFWTCKDQSIYVDMMTRRGRFNVVHILHPSMQVVKIPYYNEELFMFVFVPEHHFTTDEILENLTYEQLQEWIRPENMRNVEMTFSMPRFIIENETQLKPIFSNMGVNDLFTPGKADLSGMTADKQMVVSHINQAVVFAVSEEGAEGAGASRTEVVSGSHSAVKVNKSFLFLVQHKATGLYLFFGRVCVPK